LARGPPRDGRAVPREAQALEPVWCLEGYNKQSDPIYKAMEGNLRKEWASDIETVLPPLGYP
jgi:hypothetical protein